jgi:hypothetical protein
VKSGSRKEKGVNNYEAEGSASGFTRALVAWETAHRTGLDALSALGAVSHVGHTHHLQFYTLRRSRVATCTTLQVPA